MSLPRSGTQLITSLVDSHPDITCRHDMRICDVGHAHFDQLRWEYLQSDMIKILITRDYEKGAISEIWQPYRNYEYDPTDVYMKRRIAFVAGQRELKTKLMMEHTDFTIDYDNLTEGKEILEWDCPELCLLFGIKNQTFTTNFKKFPEIRRVDPSLAQYSN